MIGNSWTALVQKRIASYAFASDLPAVNCRLFRWVENRRSEQQISVLSFSSVPQSDPIVKTKRFHKKWIKNWKRKKPRGNPCLFSNFQSNFVVEFLTFYGLNALRGTNNGLYRRLLPASFMHPKAEFKIPQELSKLMIELTFSTKARFFAIRSFQTHVILRIF